MLSKAVQNFLLQWNYLHSSSTDQFVARKKKKKKKEREREEKKKEKAQCTLW
jgi:hypothetical protein